MLVFILNTSVSWKETNSDHFCLFLGRPDEQDDSENSTIYITGLTDKANLEDMAEFFKHVGPIRVRKFFPLDFNGSKTNVETNLNGFFLDV